MLMEHVLCDRQYTKLLTHINSFKFHSNSMRYATAISPFYRWEAETQRGPVTWPRSHSLGAY